MVPQAAEATASCLSPWQGKQKFWQAMAWVFPARPSLRVAPTPIHSHTVTALPRGAWPYPQGQGVFALQADATLIGDLREIFILKLLQADVMGEPGGVEDGKPVTFPGHPPKGGLWQANGGGWDSGRVLEAHA